MRAGPEVSRPAILVFVGCYLPGFKGGGPIRTTANLVDQLQDSYAFKIVTDDRDHGDSMPYRGVYLNQWTQVGNADVYYASRNRQTLTGLIRFLRGEQYDVLYLNSLFSPKFTLLPMLAMRLGLSPRKPVIIAPRGELGEGALALKSRKKRLFLWFAARIGLYRDVIWQASSDNEAKRITEMMNVTPDEVVVAPNLAARPLGLREMHRLRSGERPTIVFLSRIARMKNLDYAIRVLARVSTPVNFFIYGAIEDSAYWAECQELIASVPGHIRVRYQGELRHEQVHEALVGADLFFLPTRGENYGHAVIEALGAGVPALISDRTPWGDLYESGAGWSLPLEDMEAFVSVIDGWANEPPEIWDTRSRSAYEYAAKVALSDDALDANVRMFASAIAAEDH